MSRNRLIVFEDMLEARTGDVLYDIGVSKKRARKTKPRECPDCHDRKVRGIEVLGAYDGPILWGCMHCGFLQRRFNKKDTEQMLDNVKYTYTNPNDWGWSSRSDFS